jgi:hypothetical protein
VLRGMGGAGAIIAKAGAPSMTLAPLWDPFMDDLFVFVLVGSSVLSFFFFDIISVPRSVDYPRDWQALQNKSSKIFLPK